MRLPGHHCDRDPDVWMLLQKPTFKPLQIRLRLLAVFPFALFPLSKLGPDPRVYIT